MVGPMFTLRFDMCEWAEDAVRSLPCCVVQAPAGLLSSLDLPNTLPHHAMDGSNE